MSLDRNSDSVNYKALLEKVESDPNFVFNILLGQSNLSDEEAKQLYLALVKKNVGLFKNIPKNKLDHDICLAAVRQNWDAIQDIPEDKLDHDICLAAVEKSWIALYYIPEEKRDHDICVAALKNESEAFEMVPKDKRHDVYLAVVKENGNQLGGVPKEYRDKDICLAAVKQDLNSLRFVPETIKHFIINTLSLEKIISEQCETRNFIPDKKPISFFPITGARDYKARVNQLLSQVEHVVITEMNTFALDPEIKDIYLVYADSPKRVGKILHVDSFFAKELFEDLKKSNNKNNINLVLLGHANINALRLGGFSIDGIMDLLENNTNINRVTLLGCNTAKSLKLDQEKEMIRRFSEKEPVNKRIGMILLSTLPDPSKYPLLDKIEKDKDGKEIEGAYVLSKVMLDGKETYHLAYIQKNPNTMKEAIIQQRFIDQKDVEKLQNQMLKGKSFSFLKDAVYIRGGPTVQSLNDNELRVIDTITQNPGKFDKAHPQYKQAKQEYPFLGNVTIEESEVKKLQKSLLKFMVGILQTTKVPSLNRDITVKGYTKAVHVDTKQKRLQVTRAHLYPEKYIASYSNTGQDNIDRKELANEQKKMIKNLEKGDIEGNTTVKSIKVNIKKRP